MLADACFTSSGGTSNGDRFSHLGGCLSELKRVAECGVREAGWKAKGRSKRARTPKFWATRVAPRQSIVNNANARLGLNLVHTSG
jgi:hypothetical protein